MQKKIFEIASLLKNTEMISAEKLTMVRGGDGTPPPTGDDKRRP